MSNQKNSMQILIDVVVNRKKIDYHTFYKVLEELFGSFVVGEAVQELNSDGSLLFINLNTMIIKEEKLSGYTYPDLKKYEYLIVEVNSEKTVQIVCYGDSVLKKNKEAFKYLKTKKWENVRITQIHNNLEVKVFIHHKKIYVVSKYGKLDNIDLVGSVNELTKKLIDKDLDSIINEEYVYTLLISCDKIRKYINQNIQFLGNMEEVIYLKEIIEKNSGKIMELTTTHIPKVSRLYFSCIDEIRAKLETISLTSKINKKISLLGYQIKIYNDNKNEYEIVEVYTETYCTLMENLPEFKNIHQLYLELYQQNRLNNFLPFVTTYTTEIKHRINNSVKTLAKEVLNIYHATRKQKNKDLYEVLPDSYKKILFNLHGLYIDDRKKDFIESEKTEYNESRSITVHDVYYYIKYLTPQQLRQLFKDRPLLLTRDKENKYMCNECIYAKTMTMLMFDEL